MKKYRYRLIAPGTKTHWNIFGIGIVKLDKPRKAIYVNMPLYVHAKNEEIARQMIKDKHHLNTFDRDGKWNGFILIGA